MVEQICPETGHPMVRDVQPMTIEYKGHSIEVEMLGGRWVHPLIAFGINGYTTDPLSHIMPTHCARHIQDSAPAHWLISSHQRA